MEKLFCHDWLVMELQYVCVSVFACEKIYMTDERKICKPSAAPEWLKVSD